MFIPQTRKACRTIISRDYLSVPSILFRFYSTHSMKRSRNKQRDNHQSRSARIGSQTKTRTNDRNLNAYLLLPVCTYTSIAKLRIPGRLADLTNDRYVIWIGTSFVRGKDTSISLVCYLYISHLHSLTWQRAKIMKPIRLFAATLEGKILCSKCSSSETLAVYLF